VRRLARHGGGLVEFRDERPPPAGNMDLAEQTDPTGMIDQRVISQDGPETGSPDNLNPMAENCMVS